jgi:hypothetical protein
VAVTPDAKSVAVLGGIVLIRTFLSFSLQLEVTGYWPWQAARIRQQQALQQAPAPAPTGVQTLAPPPARSTARHARQQPPVGTRTPRP